jgi:hypothetical protein
VSKLPSPAAPPPQVCPKLTIRLSAVDILHEPDNSAIVDVLMSACGGDLLYNFMARWGDGFVQLSNSTSFPRAFSSNQTIPRTVNVTVTS